MQLRGSSDVVGTHFPIAAVESSRLPCASAPVAAFAPFARGGASSRLSSSLQDGMREECLGVGRSALRQERGGNGAQ